MITITGIPFYDGVIEGTFYIPMKVGEFLSPHVYDMGFWFGIVIFGVILLRVVFGWD